MSCWRDMAMAGTSSLYSDADVIALLDSGGLDLPVPPFSVAATNESILGFTNHLSGMGSLSLLHADKEMAKSLSSTLKHLQNTVGTVLQTIDANQKKKRQCSYVCQKCSATLTGNSIINIWENHSHFDELLASALNNESSETEDEIEEIEDQTQHENDQGFSNSANSFRFNFEVRYDSYIEQQIYPSLFLSTLKKFKNSDCYMFQRYSPHYIICLLCCNELPVEVRIGKQQKILVNHLTCPQHLCFAGKSLNLLALREYHETFLSLEVPYQAHQVYFQPKLRKKAKCKLCNTTLPMRLIRHHINSNSHEECFNKMISSKKKEYYLNEYQAMVYSGDHRRRQNVPRPSSRNMNGAQPKHQLKRGILLHDIRISVEDPESSSFLELIPRRFENHLIFLKEEEQYIICQLCGVPLDKNMGNVLRHFRQRLHKNLSNMPLKRFSYYCYICKLKLYSDTQWQNHLMEFSERHVSSNPEVVYGEYECLVCEVAFFGDSALHVNQRDKKERPVITLPQSVYKLFQSKAGIQVQCDRLTMEAEAVIKDELTLKCCQQVENILKCTFPRCKVYPFGSRISGLGNKDSDLDMFLDFGGMYSGDKSISSHKQQVLLVKKVYSILVKLKEQFSCLVEISTARTPIVKFKHLGTNVFCDLSFKHGLSVENTKFLKFCLAMQPIAQPFILILKSWSSLNHMQDKLSTYALAILAIFYLQVNDFLLSVEEIRKRNHEREPQVIGGWETISYSKSIEEMRGAVCLYQSDIYKLVKDFFSYYHNFPFDVDVVCPLLGTTIQKERFIRDGKNGKCLPPEMKRYVEQLGRPEAEVFKAGAAFCIQDPFDLSHNLTKACDKNIVDKFQRLCLLSLNHLKDL